jgi:hypothetical protein
VGVPPILHAPQPVARQRESARIKHDQTAHRQLPPGAQLPPQSRAPEREMILKAERAQQRLLLVVQGLKKLFADEHFVNLLCAEGLDTLPKYLARL